MTETITLYDENGNPVQVQPPESPNVRQMRERITELEAQAQRATDLEQQLAEQQRQMAIQAAGVQLDETKLRALEAVHQGEWTPDAVKQTAAQLGWVELPPPIPPAEQAGLGRIDAAATGGSTTPPDPDAVLDSKLAEAKTEAEFMALYRQSGRLLAP